MQLMHRDHAVINKRDKIYLRGVSAPFIVDVCHQDGTYTVVSINGRKQRVTKNDIDRIGENGEIRLTNYIIKPKERWYGQGKIWRKN